MYTNHHLEYNQYAGQGRDKFWRQASVIGTDILKATIGFIKEMIRLIMGR
jgi:hypothetical protein